MLSLQLSSLESDSQQTLLFIYYLLLGERSLSPSGQFQGLPEVIGGIYLPFKELPCQMEYFSLGRKLLDNRGLADPSS